MVALSVIDADCSVYRCHTLVVCGEVASYGPLVALLAGQGITVSYFCSSMLEEQGTFYQGVPVVAPLFLQGLVGASSFLFQFSVSEQVGYELLLEGGALVLSAFEAFSVLSFMDLLELRKESSVTVEEVVQVRLLQVMEEELKVIQYVFQFPEAPVLLCLPPKTGDHTLLKTLTGHRISCHFMFHLPQIFDKDWLLGRQTPLKVVTAVRDPIGEHLSLMYQMLGEITESRTAKALLFGRFGREFFQDGGNVQVFWDLMIQAFAESDVYAINPIQYFMEDFNLSVFPLLEYDFNQKEGYSVYQQGNLQVFVYQLERMDDVVTPLANFVGGDFTQWVRENQAADKWISSSYQKAKKELIFTRDYVEACYSAPWVSHFYSDADIKRFRSGWEEHLVD